MFPWSGLAAQPQRGGLVWEFSPGKYLPTNSYDARACYGVGALAAGGSLFTGGSVVYLPFTTDGGDPNPSDPSNIVYLAGSADDSFTDDAVTGYGKATATIPSTAVPIENAAPRIYNCKQVTPIGTCIGLEDVPGSRFFKVRLFATPFGPIPNTVPSNFSQTFHGIQCIAGDYNAPPYFETPATAQTNINPGETMVLTFCVDNVSNTEVYPGHYTGIQCNTNGAAPGFEFSTGTRGIGSIIAFNDTSGANSGYLGDLQPGINRIAMTNVGGLFRISSNHIITHTFSSTGAISISGTFRVYWSIGAFCSIVKLARTMTDTELEAVTDLGLRREPGENAWGPDPTLIADSSCQWYLDLTTYTGGTITSIAGPAGTGFSWTKAGTPTIRTWTINWNYSLAGLFQSGPPVVYDQKHAIRTGPNAEMIFTCPNQSDFINMITGFISEDVDNSDEGAMAVIANGVPIGAYGPGSQDGTLNYDYVNRNVLGGGAFWQNKLGDLSGPWHCRLLIKDQLARGIGHVQGGKFAVIGIPDSFTIDTSATTRRMMIIADGGSMAGHLVDYIQGAPSSGAPLNRMRAVYPGKITADSIGVLQFDRIFKWGNGSMSPYAQWIYDQSKEGAPTLREYFFMMGYVDWQQDSSTCAVFATRYQALINALLVLDPGVRIWVALPIQTARYADTNLHGETLQLFVNAVGAITGVTHIDVTGPTTIPMINSGQCPDFVGQQALADNIKLALNY